MKPDRIRCKLTCRCGREVEVEEAAAPGATYTCADCNPKPRLKYRWRTRKTLLFSELRYSSDAETPLSGESAVEHIYVKLDQPHITPGWLQANTPRERECGAAYQNFLDEISTDRPRFNKNLRTMLDEDELLVLAARAMGFSRREYAARLKPNARIKFENAWRRMSPKMDSVRTALKKAVRAQIVYD